mmetsp:Transcript_13465/g.32027  ORF Transcript_13465/g.32027 Transcript_13465/m.32027 type:complete len:243 (-) Transcript_13465:294-1022(-)
MNITTTQMTATTPPPLPMSMARRSSLVASTERPVSSSSPPDCSSAACFAASAAFGLETAASGSSSPPSRPLRISDLMMPACERRPTASATKRPWPSITLVPDSTIGLSAFFLIRSDSPVWLISSHLMPEPDTKMPSAPRTMPTVISITSPTTTSWMEISLISPSRTTLMLSFSMVAFSAKNWRSFSQSLPAVTLTTTTTAKRMAIPSIGSSSNTPAKIRLMIPAAMSMMSVGSCSASQASCR